MTLTPEAALALRQPFPTESVGKLPKPYRADSPKSQCAECGGYHGIPAVHLDYVGHAAVTDRLLTVDPHWNWEPFATDPLGLPLRDQQGNLWIRLTICGVTRIGVGDGKSLKECIGDAIRNAAMRFGVALDLWAKENLVEFAQAVREHQATSGVAGLRSALTGPPAAPEQPAEPAPDEPAEDVALPTITKRQQGKLFALFAQKGIPEHEQKSGIETIVGHPVAHRTSLTGAEFEAVIARLESLPDAVTE